VTSAYVDFTGYYISRRGSRDIDAGEKTENSTNDDV
jgi:hypothetical protein